MTSVSRMVMRTVWVIGMLLFALPVHANGLLLPAPIVFERKQVADAPAGRAFGDVLALSGDRLVVGHAGAGAEGRAYVYVRGTAGTWTLEATLQSTGEDDDGIDGFGAAVAIDGNLMVVGAPHEGESGHAYVFMRSAGRWQQISKLGISSDWLGFGGAVALEKDILVVSARHYIDPAYGVVQIYKRSGTQWNRLTWGYVRNDGGCALSLRGGQLAIGEPAYDDSRGRVMLASSSDNFSRWRLLERSGGSKFDRFGAALWMSDDMLVVGAPYASHNGLDEAGAAYVYTRRNGEFDEGARILPTNPIAGGGFGASVTVTSGMVLVGAPDTANGEIHLFVRSTVDGGFVASRKLTAGGDTWGGLGSAMVASHERFLLIAGAPYGGGDRGMVYEWTRKILPLFPGAGSLHRDEAWRTK